MAKQLDRFPSTVQGRRRYPWEEWFDGKIWMLVRGEDFDVSPESMDRAVRAAAVRMGVRVRTQRLVAEQGIVIQSLGFRAGSTPGEGVVTTPSLTSVVPSRDGGRRSGDGVAEGRVGGRGTPVAVVFGRIAGRRLGGRGGETTVVTVGVGRYNGGVSSLR